MRVVEVRGDVWIVEDLGGERHEIKVGDDTDVIREVRSISPRSRSATPST